MQIKTIKTKKDHAAALRMIEKLMTAKANTTEGELLDVLVTLVQVYEAKNIPMDLPDAVAAIEFQMEQKSLSAKDLTPMIGRLNRVYEILNRKRPLTLRMIWNLNQQLGIPAESLIKQSA